MTLDNEDIEALGRLIDNVIENRVSQALKRFGMPDPEWVTKERAMEILNCRESKLLRLRKEGLIIRNCHGKGQTLMYKTLSLKQYIEREQKAPQLVKIK
jgi:stress response protein YsnF